MKRFAALTANTKILFFLFALASPLASAAIPGDINSSGTIDAVDIQLVINAALDIESGYDCDINGDGHVNALDVQLVINAALGLGVTVPEVAGLTQPEAEAAIIDAGLTVGFVTQTYSPTVPAGNVISQYPLAGFQLLPASAVDLVISLGLQSSQTETILLPGNVPLEMVWIPAGTFMMGRNPGEQHSFDDEAPRHRVTLTSGYWLAKYELTKRQWQAVMGTTPWLGQQFVLNDLDSPAVYVSWDDAKLFITTLNTYTGLTFRLPSEAQWEYACRAGTMTRFYWGDDRSYTLISNYAWYFYNAFEIGEAYPHVVGLKLPNAFGLYDMSGNAWEWCEDDWHGTYTGAPTNGAAWVNSPRGSGRMGRGGFWNDGGNGCRSASRQAYQPFMRPYWAGFRLAR